MEPKRPRRRPAPRSGRSIWRTLNSRPDGCAPTSASFTIPAIPNPGSLPCPNGRATCAPWTTARGGASSQCSRTSNRAVSALRTPRSASLTAWIASSWSWPSPSTGRSPQDSGMPSTMPLPAKKKRSRSTQESGPQPNLLVHQGPPPHRQDRPILPAAPAPLGGAAKLMDGKALMCSISLLREDNLTADIRTWSETPAEFHLQPISVFRPCGGLTRESRLFELLKGLVKNWWASDTSLKDNAMEASVATNSFVRNHAGVSDQVPDYPPPVSTWGKSPGTQGGLSGA